MQVALRGDTCRYRAPWTPRCCGEELPLYRARLHGGLMSSAPPPKLHAPAEAMAYIKRGSGGRSPLQSVMRTLPCDEPAGGGGRSAERSPAQPDQPDKLLQVTC